MDFSYVETISGGDKEFAEEFLETFVSTTHSLIESLKESLAAKDLERIQSNAHQLKPTLKMLELKGHDNCAAINQDPKIATLEMILEIERECEEAKIKMSEHFNL